MLRGGRVKLYDPSLSIESTVRYRIERAAEERG
jgi:hypothetical protein